MNRIILSSSILSADFSRLGDEIRCAEAAGVDWIHVDVMDGHFVPNLTMGPFIVEHCRRITNLPLDVHLMVENPERLVEPFAHAGANRLTIHVEENPNLHRTIQAIRSLDCHPGVAINPGTAANALEAILPDVDQVLVMTVNPGYSSQQFLPGMVKKIARVEKMITEGGYQTAIQVDGGITAETLPLAYAAGARLFVAATAIFKYPKGIAAGIAALRAAV